MSIERLRTKTTVAAPPLAKRIHWEGFLLTLLTYVLTIVIFFPILWMVLTGLKTEANAVALPPSLFFQPTFDNFRNALTSNYFDFFKNSAIMSIGSTILAFALGIPAAYSLAMFPTKRSANVLGWVLSTKMLPIVGALIPLIVIYKQIGLYDSRLGLTLLYAASNLPLVIWLMRSFLSEVPKELVEAAEIDGAGFLRTLRQIVLPLALPGIGATALLCLIFVWNEFILAVNLTAVNASTLPVYISGYQTSEGLFWAKMSAAATVAIAPVMLAGWAAQRSLVRGLTLGAVKG
jgi:sorbitol/mannitol transport system permease protein